MNPILEYTQMILKAEENIEGYVHFSGDVFGNITQVKKLDSSELPYVRKELEWLASLE